MESDAQPACYRHPSVPTRIICQRCDRPICTECMVPGAVGFQCPDCVATGQRQTRQTRLPYGGERVANPRVTSIVLIGLNLAVFVGILLTGGAYGRLFNLVTLKPQGFCPVGTEQILIVDKAGCLAAGQAWVDGAATGAWWQILTNAFAHAEPMHIAFNMLALWFLGPQLEQLFGRARFLAIYLGSAVAASAFVMWFAGPHVSTLGASGAVFGLMAAFLVVAYKHKGNYQQVLMWLGLNLVITVVGSAYISWQGHLGGFLGGLAITVALVYLPRSMRSRWQWPLVAVLVLVATAAIVARAMVLA